MDELINQDDNEMKIFQITKKTREGIKEIRNVKKSKFFGVKTA